MTWLKRLETARTIGDWIRLDSLQSWKNCVIGENRKKLEKVGYIFGLYGYPYDKKLRDLGYKFSRCVGDKNKKNAISILNKIIELTKRRLKK